MGDWDTLFPDEQTATGASLAAATRSRLPSRIRVDPDNVRNGLVQLVLTLVELIRELLERQALRRIDGGSLTARRDRAAGPDLPPAFRGDGPA